MPCVKGVFSGHQLLINAGFFNPSEISEIGGTRTINQGKFFPCLALLDTGATRSCIGKKIVQSMGLQPDGVVPVSGVHGRQETKTYTAGLVIPEVSYMQEEITVLEMKLEDDSPYQALLGMDILSKGSFQLDFSGSFIFCI